METIDNPSGIDVRGTMAGFDKSRVDRIHAAAPDLFQAILEVKHILSCSLEELDYNLLEWDLDSLGNVHLESAKDAFVTSIEKLRKASRDVTKAFIG